jgi:TPR repeat protein
VRGHFQQLEKQKAQRELELELCLTTTPLSSPRGEQPFNSPALFEALKLFTAASRKAHLQAQYTLGLCYATGAARGIADEMSAFPWLLLAAQQVPHKPFVFSVLPS